MSQSPKCVCGKDIYKTVFSGRIKDRSFEVIKCQNCGLSRTWPEPVASEADQDFYEEQSDFQERLKQIALWRKFANNTLKIVYKYLPQGKIMDIGTNLGVFVEQAVKMGYDAYGLDFSGSAIESGKKELKLGDRLRHGSSISLSLPDESYDMVSCIHVIEHFTRLDQEIREIRRILKSKGYFVIETPNFQSLWRRVLGIRWYGLVPYQHIWQFDKVALSDYLKRNGFDIVMASTRGSLYHPLRFTPIGLLKLFIRWLAFATNTGDNLIIIAQKND